MEGNISLKKFILGVKQELQDASAEGSKNPFLELTQVELEAEFSLEASGGVEGGFSFIVKAKADAAASQSHKVKLIFSPLSIDDTTTTSEGLPPQTYQLSISTTSTSSKKSVRPTFLTVSPLVVGRTKRQSRYFVPQPVVIGPKIDVDDLVKKVMLEINEPNKKDGGSEEGGA